VRILLVTQYFTPEMTAASARLAPFAAGLAARGHEVEVVAGLPNHPQGVIYDGFEGSPLVRRRGAGFRVSHVWVHASPKKGMKSRLLSYGSYAASATVAGALRRRPDVVLASSPPLSVGAVGLTLARLHRAPLVLDIRDLWPEIAVSLGELSDPKVIEAVESLEGFLYRSAAAVTTPTEAFAAHIRSIAGEDKAMVIPNGTTEAWLAAAEREADRGALDLPEGFLWTYAGNVGLSQDLGVAARAAEKLGQEFTLLILGSGSTRSELEAQARELPNARIIFRGPVDQATAIEYVRASDALLVPLADDPAVAKSVPIKLYDFCAVGRPVIVAAPGEPARLASAHGLGLVVAPGDPEALAAAVRELQDDEAKARGLAESARAWAAGQLRESQVERLEAVLSRAGGS
jgi:glycosyltransferase involved in cell wall biosynthesis